MSAHYMFLEEQVHKFWYSRSSQKVWRHVDFHFGLTILTATFHENILAHLCICSSYYGLHPSTKSLTLCVIKILSTKHKYTSAEFMLPYILATVLQSIVTATVITEKELHTHIQSWTSSSQCHQSSSEFILSKCNARTQKLHVQQYRLHTS